MLTVLCGNREWLGVYERVERGVHKRAGGIPSIRDNNGIVGFQELSCLRGYLFVDGNN